MKILIILLLATSCSLNITRGNIDFQEYEMKSYVGSKKCKGNGKIDYCKFKIEHFVFCMKTKYDSDMEEIQSVSMSCRDYDKIKSYVK